MSAPGSTNLSSSVSYNQNSTPNGGAAPPYQNGPAQTYPSMYPPTGYYGAPPQQQSYPTIPAHSTPVPNKAPITNSAHSANYYQNNHQQQHHHLPQHHVAPSPYSAPPSSAPPSQPYATLPSSAPPPPNTQYNQQPFQQQQQQQHPPYATPGSYYGQQSYHAPPAQQQHPSLVPAPASGPGAPLYPIVSYPSAPGSSQYGTLSSSQSTSTPGVMPIQMGAPLHQYSTSQPASTTPVQPGYGGGPPSQMVPAVNGQGSTAQTTVHQHYHQSHKAPQSYDSYGRVTHSTGGPDGERLPSGTPSTSVHSSPGRHQGMQYGYVANSGASSASAATSGPATAPSSSSSDDDEEEEDEDEEAGGDTSSSTTGSASPVPNSYDSLEGGNYPDSMPPSNDMTNQAQSYGSYGYPSMQPAYRQGPASHSDSSPTHDLYGQSSYQQYSQPFPNLSQLSAALGGLSGVPELEVEALRPVNLLQERNLLPPRPLEAPEPNLSPDLRKVNCSPQTFRCTLTSIPQTQALLNKARLPLGLLLHPFRDLQQLPVITSNTIVRCRSCRTYINPFVTFLDQRRWKCNLCYRVNDVPDEFMYNPVTRSYGEPHKRPEVQNSTVEFIASSDYMLRPPQPAVYLFVLDVSHNAVEAGYLKYLCESLLDNLDKLPGDTRTRVGFLTFDSTIHFYNLQEGLSQPQMLVVSDIDDVFIPSHDSLMVNLKESKELVKDLLTSLPAMFSQSRETHSALGPALQAAFKLMSPTGGRVTVFQTQLPTLGAGMLQSREDPNQRSSSKGVQNLGPATDFYKKLALDCSGQQIGVDLFLLSSQYADLASLACISKYSAGSIFYYPSFHYIHNPAQLEKFQGDLERYLTRKIGFEAVMRIRCTKGLSIHTFHGNFFVRSTDLLSLANVNPDSAFAVQMSIEDSLADSSLACFQAALLYTSNKGKRRIRVHTLCLPVVNQLSDVYAGADVQAITCLLANMAIDRSISSSLSDARDALVNAVVDLVSAYKSNVSNLQQSGLVVPASMCLFPLYILALLKQRALRTGTSTRLDERVFAMCEFKTQPLQQLMRMVHPDLYRLDNMSDQGALHLNDTVVPQPHLLHLSAERVSRDGAFLMDCGNVFYLWIGKCCNEMFVRDVLGCPNYASIPPNMSHIPELETPLSERVRAFLDWLQDNRAFSSTVHVVKDDASVKSTFFQHMVEDRSESASSYHEFLQHVQLQMSK
ncbi:protein transport protein Sec24B-like isoform X1 [Seriola lalandi dorsalis]|uniref:protein transport protein Sec24B-like isoform X1 n=1 Tax=Seriola lalandi dorsalis TaxID=1841481 RepID=UPI000C6F75B0|nr:protein transport protein Sec24B-like isoform X1 [Seriola lalandi dorsalis]XP_056239225.1 protein transport protein Sec24B isoform X1 [Seriola aureovittata]